jgi:S1-C subfamily serine protease
MIIDILIIVVLISAFIRGHEIGFTRQLFSTVGFFGGLFMGALLQPYTVKIAQSATDRALVTIATTIGMALIFLTIGEYIGMALKHKVLLKSVNEVDDWLGAGLSVVSLLLSIWLSASILTSLPLPSVQAAVRSSRIIAAMNRTLPSAPTVIADLGHLIDPNGFPEVFIGGEPTPAPNVPLPNLGSLTAAVNKDRASVVKIEGQGCGGVVEGSGFVVSNDLVATNAHVVAGIAHPYVQDGNGTHSATVIWFDPNLDFAVLRVSNLSGGPLTVNSGIVKNGTPGAVLGYPGGGPFSADPAAVSDEFDATGRNIYGTGYTDRDVYEIQANIIPGNSGGPLVNSIGDVIGIVFAESTSYNHVGYALTTNQALHELSEAEASNQAAVGTGSCAQ